MGKQTKNGRREIEGNYIKVKKMKEKDEEK